MKKYLTIMILAFLAFINATYLTNKSYLLEHTPISDRSFSFCDINASFSCTNVLENVYSKIFGIPFPAYAMIVYPIIFCIAYLGYRKRSLGYFGALLPIAVGGILFNSFFIYREIVFIHAYCYLCLICSGIIFTIAIISMIGFRECRLESKFLR